MWKIVKNLTLKNYLSTYKEYIPFLSKYTKEDLIDVINGSCRYGEEISDINKNKIQDEAKLSFLKTKKWCLINNVYYQIPNKIVSNKSKQFVTIDETTFGHTLQDYDKKYRNLTHNLAKLTKKQVEDFDKQYGHYFFSKSTYTLNFQRYLLLGKKWWFINDTYYEIPQAPRLTWYRNLKTSTQIFTSVLLGGSVVAGVAMPLYFGYFSKIISLKIEDLLPTDKEERAAIVDNCDITNTKVMLGEDFNTVVQLKADKINDYNIQNIRIFTFKDEPTSNLEKVELVKGKDFVVQQEKKKATIKVFASSFNNKLELNVKLKEINFNNFVNFDDQRFKYDENKHDIKFSLKEGKELPADTSIKYTYKDQTKTGEDFFSFTDAGTYKVTLELSAPDFNDYSKSINVVIDKKELSDYQKSQIYFDNLTQKIGSIVHPSVVNTTGIPAVKETDFEYLINGKWGTTLPDEKGTYKVRKTLGFANYNDYTIEGNYIVNPYATITVTFDVKSNGGTWGGTSYESITTDPIDMVPTGLKFGVFIDNLEKKTTYAEPYKVGHSFNGIWYDNEADLNRDSVISYTESFTVKAKFDINSYKITFDPNGGTATTTSTNLDYDKPIKENISGISIPTHSDGGLFKGWGESNDTREVIKDTLKMPAKDITLYALWYKYDFEFVDGDHGTATTEEGTKLSNLISLKEKPASVTITPNNGYAFNGKYDVYFGNDLALQDFSFDKSSGNIIAPGLYDKKEDAQGNNLKIKIKPKFDALDIKAAIDADGGVVKKGENVITSLDIKCDDHVINYLTDMTATKDHTRFEEKWLITDGATTKVVDGTTIMPAYPVTLKPVYHSYTINVEGDDHLTIDTSTTTFTNRIVLHSDEIKYTVDNNYIFKGFEYSFDGSNYSPLVYGMPLIPYEYDKANPDLHDNIYLRITSEEIKETMQVFVDAGEGQFPDGTNYKVVKLNKGKTLQDVLNTLGDVKKGSSDPIKWVDKDNNTINLSTPISGVDIYYAKAVFE